MTSVAALNIAATKPAHSTSNTLLIQRKCACGGAAGFSGACSECEKRRFLGQPFQAKAAINEPGNEYEREADRVAEHVLRVPDQNAGDHSLPSPLVERRMNVPSSAVGETPAIVNEVLSTSGHALDSEQRDFFEARFRHDFGRVRVHSDARAAESARAVNALAYTFGSDIVFGTGLYTPTIPSGRALLAHELAHVVQQSRHGQTIQRKLRVDEPETQATTPMESPYIIFQDAVHRVTDRLVIYVGDDLTMEKWPFQQPRTLERFVRRAMDAGRVYHLRLAATDLSGRQVRGGSWERKGEDVVLTFNPIHLGQFIWTLDELLAQQLASAVAANDPEEIPSTGKQYMGTMEELMSIPSEDEMFTARLPYGSTDKTKLEQIKTLQVKSVQAVQELMKDGHRFRHLTPRQRNDLVVSVVQADGVTLLEILQGIETNSRYRVVDRRQGNRQLVTYKDPALSQASVIGTIVSGQKTTFVPGADLTAGPVPLPLTGVAHNCNDQQNQSEANSCCTDAMINEISSHLQVARAYTQRAIERLESGAGVDCYLKRNFGGKVTDESRREIVNRLRIVSGELFLSRHAWKCREQGSGFLGCVSRDRGTVAGRVERKDVFVLLCVNEEPNYTDWVSVLHEIVHRTGIFGEEIYKGESGYPGKNASHNADSYARLAEDVGAPSWKPCGKD